MSAPSAPAPQPSAEDLALGLFARASLDLFDVWPALRLAISHGWGGNGTQGKTALAEDVVDLFYTVATSGGAASSATAAATAAASTSTQEGGVPIPAQDEVEQTLLYVIGNEFDVDLEDGSEAAIARDLIKLWRECIQRVQAQLASGAPTSDEGPLAKDFRERAERARAQDGQQRFAAQRQGGQGGDDDDDETTSEEDDDDDELDEDDEMEGVIDEPVPQLVEAQRPEPVVDEDGFELVQPKKKGGRK
ncbi:hypothetical protein BMF94_2825 [Rhodotorula taiwanensis]|uniref:Pre-rRNA-processing protein TSR2 n=1 Tax=Rhodotorula taiwanensis TaxID=741276 RepID=A0A2S5BB70_9BASI|nr:hypothetical protein BMF94_2825 [Rhodotorula taiwanensis]